LALKGLKSEHKVLVEKPEGYISVGRRKIRWVDNIKRDFIE
jgi:hypothetical protein